MPQASGCGQNIWLQKGFTKLADLISASRNCFKAKMHFYCETWIVKSKGDDIFLLSLYVTCAIICFSITHLFALSCLNLTFFFEQFVNLVHARLLSYLVISYISHRLWKTDVYTSDSRPVHLVQLLQRVPLSVLDFSLVESLHPNLL